LFTLTADAEDELHAFAGRLGLRQDLSTAAGSQPEHVTRHYTLTESERDRAVELGAQVITAREADKQEAGSRKQEAGSRQAGKAAGGHAGRDPALIPVVRPRPGPG
jgi:hypothetical protein